MKKRFLIPLLLMVLLTVSLTNHAAFADSSLNSKASVEFEDGTVEFFDPELDPNANNLDFYFGSHPLPVGPSKYKAEDGTGTSTGSHTLRVLDSQEDAGGWHVTVKMTSFTAEPPIVNTFAATITLTDPTVTVGLVAVTPREINDVEATVVTANSGLQNNTYDTTWTQDKIELSIGAAAASSIQDVADYAATITWTLIL